MSPYEMRDVPMPDLLADWDAGRWLLEDQDRRRRNSDAEIYIDAVHAESPFVTWGKPGSGCSGWPRRSPTDRCARAMSSVMRPRRPGLYGSSAGDCGDARHPRRRRSSWGRVPTVGSRICAVKEVPCGRTADGVRMLIVPGSMKVRTGHRRGPSRRSSPPQAPGLRLAGCSMCPGMNP